MENIYKKGSKGKINAVIAVSIIILAILTRFLWFEKTSFFINDQGRDLMELYKMVTNKKIVLLGPPTSFFSNFAGIYFGPHYYYFLLPFFLISKEPLFISAIVPVLFLLSIIAVFKLKDLNLVEKTIYPLLIIFSSFSLYYTRFLWNLNLAFLLSFLMFCLFFLFEKKIYSSPLIVFIFGCLSGSIFQMHYGMLFLYTGFFYLFFKKRRLFLYYILGFILSFAPFFIFNIRHGGILIKAMINGALLFTKQTTISSLPVISIFKRISDYYFFPYPLPYTLKVLFGFLAFFGAWIFLFKKKTNISSFLAFIFPIFLITLIFFKRDFDYYLACFFMWYYLGLAMALAWLIKKRNVFSLMAVVSIVFFVFINLRYYFSSANTLYGIATQEKIAQIIASDALKLRLNLINLDLRPNPLDKRGIEYLLLAKYSINTTTVSQKVYQYFVCFHTYYKCRTRGRNVREIYKDNQTIVYFIDNRGKY